MLADDVVEVYGCLFLTLSTTQKDNACQRRRNASADGKRNSFELYALSALS